MSEIRKAVIHRRNGKPTPEEVLAYLPGNYKLISDAKTIVIAGVDNAGWTLDGYVIPRLASGLIFAKEVPRW